MVTIKIENMAFRITNIIIIGNIDVEVIITIINNKYR